MDTDPDKVKETDVYVSLRSIRQKYMSFAFLDFLKTSITTFQSA